MDNIEAKISKNDMAYTVYTCLKVNSVQVYLKPKLFYFE